MGRHKWISRFILVTLLAAPAVMAQPANDHGKALTGKDLFRSFCATCHGKNAEGDGPLAEVLSVAPTNLTLLASENGGDFPAQRTRKIIDGREKVLGHGSADMPAWGDAFMAVASSEEEVAEKIDSLVSFLASIQADRVEASAR